MVENRKRWCERKIDTLYPEPTTLHIGPCQVTKTGEAGQNDTYFENFIATLPHVEVISEIGAYDRPKIFFDDIGCEKPTLVRDKDHIEYKANNIFTISS